MKFKAASLQLAEAALSIGAVLVFFLLFMGILGLSFPQGTGLRDLLLFEESADLDGHAGLDLSLDGGDEETIGLVARLTNVSRRVKDKRANAISWQDARSGIALENRHAVQTFGRSEATIAFDENNVLDLGENSLVIIRRLEQTQDFKEKRASLVILDGELKGSVVDRPAEAMELEIVTASAISTIRSAAAEQTDFKIVTHDDDSASIAVYTGQAEIRSGGRTVLVPADHVINVDAGGKILPAVRIPAVTRLLEPPTRSEFAFRSVPPAVRLAWEPVDSAESYRLELARDRGFADPVLKKAVNGTELTHGNLAAGRYYWRVTGLNAGVEGPTGTPRMFDVVHDDIPPGLEVELPGPTVVARSFVLRGVTEPGAQVFVGDRAIPISPTGTFEYDLSLEPGINVLVVESFDAAGNASYVSQMVRARY